MKPLVLVVLLSVTFPVAAARRRAVRVTPRYPPCNAIIGTAAVTFTHDSGISLAPSLEPRRGPAYTYGLAAMLDEADTFVAWHGNDLLYSSDAGCSWRAVATVDSVAFPPRLEPGRGGRAYAWSDNRDWAARFDSRGLRELKVPVEIIGLAADPQNGERVRIGGNDGTIWETADGGESWTRIGTLAGQRYLFYRFAFDPFDWNHIVAGMVTSGAYVSRDGGTTWTHATGFGSAGANVFNLVHSPSRRERVWAMGLDTTGLGTKRIYLSDDGGLSYRPVVDETAGLNLINGPIMAPDPANADLLYFIFGSHVFNYGTDIFRYDDATKKVTVAHHDEVDDVNAIAFSANHPGLMYLGMAILRQ